jgi:RND family efflux transporter MFP subunit
MRAYWLLAVVSIGGTAALAADESPTAPLEVMGKTRCMLSHRGIIAPAILRPVVAVLINPGDKVKKGQAMVKLYDLEAQAKVRAREKELKSIQARAAQSTRSLELAEQSRKTGALPENSYNEIRATALSNERQVQAAEAELTLAQSELKLYTLTAPIDGEVAWLDVSPGTVSWPGSMVWGEIVDLHELDVRCELTPLQADRLLVGQAAEVRLGGNEPGWNGKVVFIAKVAERATGLVPVTVRIANPQERLRAEVAVKVRFQFDKGK